MQTRTKRTNAKSPKTAPKKLKAVFKQSAQNFRRWLDQYVEIRLRHEAVPFDWDNLELGEFPHTMLSLEFGGKTTLFEWEQRRPKHPPMFEWNSEHLAAWLGQPSQVISGHQNGCDVDLVTYTAQPLWGLLGEHTYTE